MQLYYAGLNNLAKIKALNEIKKSCETHSNFVTMTKDLTSKPIWFQGKSRL
jgi:hypothetical protein